MIAKILALLALAACTLAAEHSLFLGKSESRLQVEHVLATYPEHCVAEATQLLQAQELVSLLAFGNCSKGVITADLKNVTVATMKMATVVGLDITSIVVSITKCVGDTNPISIAICVIRDIVHIPGEISDIIKAVEVYIAETKESWPELFSEIKKCFKKSSDDYDIFLQNFTHKAEICKRNGF